MRGPSPRVRLCPPHKLCVAASAEEMTLGGERFQVEPLHDEGPSPLWSWASGSNGRIFSAR
jgi:hypothetical protein